MSHFSILAFTACLVTLFDLMLQFFKNSLFFAFLTNFCPLKMKRLLASLAMMNETFSMILNHCDVPGIRRFPSRCGWLFWWRGTSRGIWPHERSRFAHLVCKHYVRWSRCESPVFVWKISAKNDKNVEGHLLKSSLLLDNFAPSPQTNTYCRSTSDTDLIPELWAIKSTAWMAKTVIV